MKFMSLMEARAIAGPLSYPSKMPCPSYGLPATACLRGSRLVSEPGSICSKCYALKGNYAWLEVVKGWQQFRLKALGHRKWVDAMVSLIMNGAWSHFRWHDAGDLQALWHLRKIVAIAKLLPRVQFWLPTRELETVRAYLARYGPFPKNLTVRLSAERIDGPAPEIEGLPTSGVHTQKPPIGAVACRARELYENHCGPCRACWDPAVKHVSYPLH